MLTHTEHETMTRPAPARALRSATCADSMLDLSSIDFDALALADMAVIARFVEALCAGDQPRLAIVVNGTVAPLLQRYYDNAAMRTDREIGVFATRVEAVSWLCDAGLN